MSQSQADFPTNVRYSNMASLCPGPTIPVAQLYTTAHAAAAYAVLAKHTATNSNSKR